MRRSANNSLGVLFFTHDLCFQGLLQTTHRYHPTQPSIYLLELSWPHWKIEPCCRYWSRHIDTGKHLFVWNLQKSLLDGALKYRHLHKAAASLSGMVEEEKKDTWSTCVQGKGCRRNHCTGYDSSLLSSPSSSDSPWNVTSFSWPSLAVQGLCSPSSKSLWP